MHDAQYYVRRVAEFHRKHLAPVGAGSSDSVLILRQSLIYEEAGEVFLALHDRNEVDLVDGLGDLLYVTAGTWVAVIGIRELPPQIEVPDFEPPPVWHAMFIAQLRMRINVLIGHAANLKYGGVYGTLIHNAIYAMAEIGYDPRAVFDEIHASNMTKTPTKGDIRVRVKGPDYRAPDVTRFLRGS